MINKSFSETKKPKATIIAILGFFIKLVFVAEYIIDDFKNSSIIANMNIERRRVVRTGMGSEDSIKRIKSSAINANGTVEKAKINALNSEFTTFERISIVFGRIGLLLDNISESKELDDRYSKNIAITIN